MKTRISKVSALFNPTPRTLDNLEGDRNLGEVVQKKNSRNSLSRKTIQVTRAYEKMTFRKNDRMLNRRIMPISALDDAGRRG